MAGTSAGASKRERCATCSAFKHSGECPKTGRKKVLTDAERRANETAYAREWRQKNPDAKRVIAQRYRANVKLRVFSHYSKSDVPDCACCGVVGLVFLTLDHMNGDGAEARKASGSKGGVTYYLRLIREEFPEGYQVLCWNCNAAKHLLGTCPHKENG